MRDATTVDTHTGAYGSCSWLLEDWFAMITGTNSLSCDHRTLLVIGGIDTLASHVMQDVMQETTTVDTQPNAHGYLVVFWRALWMKSTITMIVIVYRLCIQGSGQK
jgi:hypothetical protein